MKRRVLVPSLEAKKMKTTGQPDNRFLRRILFALVFCTVVTGGVATYAAVSAQQAGVIQLSLSPLSLSVGKHEG